ncbi:MAG: ABC transporter ATP-binding protein [Chloroflexi bacterium]|nr:ABC transporter ATP-binding protein [Chloroflexota bacterium]
MAVAPSPDALVEIREASKSFGDQVVLDGLDLIAPRGQIFGLFGPSGSGKTTTIRLICGLFEPTAGSVSVFGVSPHQFGRKHRERIGYMAQQFVLYPTLSVLENLNFMASVYGLGWLRRRHRIRQVLEFVELYEHRNKTVDKISGGMKRRLDLATVLLHRPELLIMDEPTAGIDPLLREKFWEQFRALANEGRTLFITSQYLSEAENCDTVAILHQSRLIAVGSPLELRRHALGGEILAITTDRPVWEVMQVLQRHPEVTRLEVRPEGGAWVYVSDAAATTPVLLNALQGAGLSASSIQPYVPPFDEIFARLVRNVQVSH